jgi:dTDP-4-amino-4,6-dideoxygalactose transaminase
MNVPFLDLKAQHAMLKNKILPLWGEILESAGFIGGPQVESLEKEFAAICNARYAIAVGSGTDALRFIFIALHLKPGDEVITVPNTFIATSEAITQAGGTPVFVDVDPVTLTMDPAKLEKAITPRTKGIVPVHLYGQCADMKPIKAIAKKHKLWVVEDACQAHLAGYNGKKAGTMGIAGAFSFYPGKNMGACGEAGAIITNDDALAATTRIIRDHGQAKKYYHDIEGFNGRCDALQAAALRVKLHHLPAWNEARRKNAALYRLLLKDVPGIEIVGERHGGTPVYHLFVVQLDNRDAVAERLKEQGIATGLHYPVPLHLQKAYAGMGLGPGSFPVAERAAEQILSLPMYPELTAEQIEYVCTCLKEAVKQKQLMKKAV